VLRPPLDRVPALVVSRRRYTNASQREEARGAGRRSGQEGGEEEMGILSLPQQPLNMLNTLDCGAQYTVCVYEN